MTYQKPEIRDLGDIAQHTYQTDGEIIIYPGGSGQCCVDDAQF